MEPPGSQYLGGSKTGDVKVTFSVELLDLFTMFLAIYRFGRF
jgi:hypothetical protein